MTNPFSHFDWSLKSIGKVLGAVVAAVVGLALVAMIISFAIRTVATPFTRGVYSDMDDFGMAMDSSIAYQKGIGGGGVYEERAFTNNILPIPAPDGGFVDADAEDYEVQSYNAYFEVGNKDKICQAVFALKSDKDIVFENANESDRSCNYTFKVIKERTEEILQIIEDLDPDELSSNTYTIQKTITGLTDYLTVLNQKLESIEETIADAQKSYDELVKLATQKRDTESLTKLIDLKLNTIERLTNERLNINQQIESVERDRAEQVQRLEYTNFNVNVYEEKLIDWKEIGENWKWELRNFIDNVNDVVQWVSIKLVSFVLYAVSSLLYLAIAFGFLKLTWILGKKVWLWKVRGPRK